MALQVKSSFLVFILLLLFSFAGCQKEKVQPREYPRLNETSVYNITDSSAVFSANLYSLGTEKILNVGFVWDEDNELSITGSNKVILDAQENTGVFSAEVKSAMKTGRKYYMKSYVQTEKSVVYGPSTEFMSLGSKAPVISSYLPHTADWGDTLIIRGKNFTYKIYDIIVKLGTAPCPVLACTDTTISVTVPGTLKLSRSTVSLEMNGNVNVFIKDTFNLNPPLLYDYSPKSGFWGDTIYITGKDFRFFKTNATDLLQLGSATCTRVGNVDEIIRFRVPDELSTASSQVKVNIGGFVLTSPVNFTLEAPSFNFAPKTGTWNETVTLTGKFNKTLSYNKVYFNNTLASIVSFTEKQIIVKIPATLAESKAVVRYVVTPFNIVSSDSFALKAPVLKSTVPSSGPSGTLVMINGKYFNSNSTKVYFGGVQAVISGMNDSTVFAKVPQGINGLVNVKIQVYSQSVTGTNVFTITNPVITGISPLNGTFNDEITISGNNFIPPVGTTSVSFGDLPAVIVSKTSTEIVVKVPENCDSIPKTISVTAGDNTTISTDKFTLDPHEITGLSTTTYTPGADITISGNNFNPTLSGNMILWDIYQLTIKSASKNEIVATWPNSLPRGTNKLQVLTGGYRRLSPVSVNVTSPWLRIEAPGILTSFAQAWYWGVRNFGESIGDKGYIVSPATSGTWEFNSTDKSWTKIGSAPYWYQAAPYTRGSSVVVNDTLYIVGPYTYTLTRGTNTWRQIGRTLPDNSVAFNLNNKIYAGLESRRGYNMFYEIIPSDNYLQTRKGDFPGYVPAECSAFFTVGNRGYIVLINNQVWEFNPDLLQWTRKADFPGQMRYFATTFSIGGFGYFGTGLKYGSSEDLSDIWKYDPANDTWALATNCPRGRYSAAAFTIGTKVYFGFGLRFSDYAKGDQVDFYEYDPYYPSK